MPALPAHPFRRLVAVVVFATCVLFGAAPAAHAGIDRSGLGCAEAVPAGVFDDSALQAEITRLVNEHRASIGVPTLQVDARLTRAAYWKTHDAFARASLYPNGIDHADPGLDGRPARQPHERAMTCGQTADTAFENLQAWASTSETAREVLDRWLGSPGHRAQLEHPNHRYVGTAASRTTEHVSALGYQWTYAQLFSYSPSPAAPACPTIKRSIPAGSTLSIDPLLCRSAGSPVLDGAAPSAGTLTGLSFRAPAGYAIARFTLLWPDTGVRQSVEVTSKVWLARAFLQRPTCTPARTCSFGYTLLRPGNARARATFQAQRLVGRRWVTSRAILLPVGRAVRGRAVRLVLARGTWRVRITIARAPAQLPDATRWMTVRMR